MVVFVSPKNSQYLILIHVIQPTRNVCKEGDCGVDKQLANI